MTVLVLEGLDGSGKSSVAAEISDKYDVPVFCNRTSKGIPWDKKDPNSHRISSMQYCADVVEISKFPFDVVVDRFALSSMVYDRYRHETNVGEAFFLRDEFLQDLIPEFVGSIVYLETSVDVLIERQIKRDGRARWSADVGCRLAELYFSAFRKWKSWGGRIYRLDARAPVAELAAAAIELARNND